MEMTIFERSWLWPRARLSLILLLMLTATIGGGRRVLGAGRDPAAAEVAKGKAAEHEEFRVPKDPAEFHDPADYDDGYFRRSENESEQWHHGGYDNFRSGVEQSVHSLIHSSSEIPLHVPMEINVVLVGFDNDGGYRYHLEPEDLSKFLTRSFPTHRPSCLETGHELEITHEIRYNVVKATRQDVMAMEQQIRRTMAHVGSMPDPFKPKHTEATVDMYDVPAEALERTFDRLYWYAFGERVSDGQHSSDHTPNAIFIFNFDKSRMDPKKDWKAVNNMVNFTETLTGQELLEQEAGFAYRYRYMGGAPTQVWLSARRYIVIDLSAGPVIYGKLGSDEGSVSTLTLPRIRNAVLPRASSPEVRQPFPFPRKHTPHTYEYMRGQIGYLVMSAVEHVFAGDIRFETLDAAHRVLVPIIVMRNHRRYNPLKGGHKHSIDMELIEREIQKMIQPGQEVVVVNGLFSLHDHEQIAMAVAKAQRSISTFMNLGDWKVLMQTHTFLDGPVLVDEMRHSPDMLAAGLLELSDPHLSVEFFNKEKLLEAQKPKDEVARSNVVLKTKTGSPKSSPGPTRTRKPIPKSARSHGTHVLPIYVMSLSGMDPGLLMSGESGLVATKDAVVVLQTNNDSIPLSYVSEHERWTSDRTSVTRDIVAGAAMALGGLAAPYERYSPRKEKRVENWIWGNGHHPFGPFSNCSTVSDILLGNMERNAIYSRVDTALRLLRKTMASMQAFTEQYLSTPLGDPVDTDKKPKKQWIDRLYKDPTASFQPLPKEVVDSLGQKLMEMENIMVDMSGLFYDHHYDEAHVKSTSLYHLVKAFEEYADDQILAAKERMRCCEVRHAPQVQSSQTLLYAGILGAGFLVYFLVIYFSSPHK